MTPRLIRTDAECRSALARVEALMKADVKPGTRAGDELDLLAKLIELYEDEREAIGPPDPIEAIRYRMEQAGLGQQDLVPYIGSRSKVSEILNGKRPLSLNMIRALHSGLGIPAAVLLERKPPALPLARSKTSPSRKGRTLALGSQRLKARPSFSRPVSAQPMR